MQPIHSLHDTLTLLASEFGVSWPNPWWPKGNPEFNDCAAAMSWALWGLNGLGNPRFSYVSQLISVFKTDGIYHTGNVGIQAGDVLVFDWNGDGSPDHTEMAVGPVLQGTITSRGTNSSGGDNMHDHTRKVGTVIGYGRPKYPGTASAGNGTQPLEDDMTDAQVAQILAASTPIKLIALTGTAGNGWVWLDADGNYEPVPPGGYAALVAAYGLSTATPIRECNNKAEWDYMRTQMLPGLKGTTPTVSQVQAILSDADVAELVAKIEAPLAAKLTSLSSTLTAAVTAALANVPGIDQAAIAAAVDTALQDNFAALPAAIVKAEGAALTNG